jgi:hypothetical protein
MDFPPGRLTAGANGFLAGTRFFSDGTAGGIGRVGFDWLRFGSPRDDEGRSAVDASFKSFLTADAGAALPWSGTRTGGGGGRRGWRVEGDFPLDGVVITKELQLLDRSDA